MGNHSPRERLAAARKRTLRSATARSARSVWSKCQSRVIESRKFNRWGSSCLTQGGQHHHAHNKSSPSGNAGQVRGGPAGSKSGAKTRRGILASWESRPVPITHDRNWTTPVDQRPGAVLDLSTSRASETVEEVWASASEGNRSKRTSEDGSLRCLIVAAENRVTETGGSL